MKSTLSILSVAVSFLVGGCGSTKPETTHHVFSFSHEGDDYEIISVIVSIDGGYNLLRQRDDGRLVLSAKDGDQNGTMDDVLIGNMSLIAANDIYAAGIEQARARGRYREQAGPRTFEFTRRFCLLLILRGSP